MCKSNNTTVKCLRQYKMHKTQWDWWAGLVLGLLLWIVSNSSAIWCWKVCAVTPGPASDLWLFVFWLWWFGDVWACAAKATYCNKSNYCSLCLFLFGAHSFALLDKEIHLHPCRVRRSHKTGKFVRWEKRVCTNVLVFLSLWEPAFHSEGLHLFQGFL